MKRLQLALATLTVRTPTRPHDLEPRGLTLSPIRPELPLGLIAPDRTLQRTPNCLEKVHGIVNAGQMR